MSEHGFQPECLPVLIGSIPMDDHQQASDLVMAFTPEIPLWVQLPAYPEEGMMAQFLPGMPGLAEEKDKRFIAATGERFEAELLAFYEEYMAVAAGGDFTASSRFVMTPETAKGFFVFMDQIERLSTLPVALKGQITGPVTFGTGVCDAEGRAIFYNEQLRDAAVKLLALKARWQVQQLRRFGRPVVIFFDEPLTGLDPLGIRRMKDSIVRRAKEGAAVIISSHLLHLLEEVCSHVLILKNGQKVIHATLDEVRQKFSEAGAGTNLEEIFFRATADTKGPS